MAKIKLQQRTVIKRDGNDVYIFRNGVATVPGVRYKKEKMKITLKEFNEISGEIDNEQSSCAHGLPPAFRANQSPG